MGPGIQTSDWYPSAGVLESLSSEEGPVEGPEGFQEVSGSPGDGSSLRVGSVELLKKLVL